MSAIVDKKPYIMFEIGSCSGWVENNNSLKHLVIQSTETSNTPNVQTRFAKSTITLPLSSLMPTQSQIQSLSLLQEMQIATFLVLWICI